MPGKKKGKKPNNAKPQPPQPPRPRKNTKVTGERSEADFQGKAIHRNFGVAKPWGDSRRYDFILDNGLCLFRIQVKCTEELRAGAYETRATYTVGKGRAVYTKKDIDFIAAHVVPLDIFYIIPVEVCTPQPMLRFYPHRNAKIMRLEKYREAWHLLEGPDHGCKIEAPLDLNASADETSHADGDENASGTGSTGGNNSVVILSEAKDLCIPPRSQQLKPEPPAQTPPRQTKPVRLKPGQAPWPTPPLRILARRQGKNILPNPDENE